MGSFTAFGSVTKYVNSSSDPFRTPNLTVFFRQKHDFMGLIPLTTVMLESPFSDDFSTF